MVTVQEHEINRPGVPNDFQFWLKQSLLRNSPNFAIQSA